MSTGEPSIAWAVVFEHAAGYRKVCAERCIVAWPVLFDTALADVDLALRVQGPVLFAVARFKAEAFTNEVANRFSILGEQAGGTVVPLSDLSIHERANFLTRVEQCVHLRRGVSPGALPEVCDRLFLVVGGRVSHEHIQLRPSGERRSAVRHQVEAPIVITQPTTGRAAPAAIENLSTGGAFVRTDHPAALQAQLSLEIQLPTGVVRTEARVVNVSATGMGVQFEPDPKVAPDFAATLEALALGPPPAPLAQSLADLTRPAAATAKPTRRLGEYELLSVLGRGATGEVHFARALSGPRQGQFVAIKQMHERLARKSEAMKLFAAEAQTLALLNHPNIVRTYEAGEFDGYKCLVMEAVDGRDLGQILRRCKNRKIFLPVDFACFLVKTLLDALAAVHAAVGDDGAPLNLVHCDVSPHNLFISRAGEIKLGDFGLAKRASRTVTDASAQGRPSYLSPEAFNGEVSVQSDLWAAAVTLYEALTLECPFTADSVEKLTAAVRKQREQPVRQRRPEISPLVERVLKRALEKSPGARFPTARDFSTALAPLFHQEVGTPLAIAAVVRGLFPALTI